ACGGSVREITIVDGNASTYSIVVPAEATDMETKAAKVLQDYLQRVSHKTLPIVKDGGNTMANAIYVGATKKAGQIIPGKLPADGYKMQVVGADVIICGGSGKGVIYGVYTFIEKCLGCRKIADAPA